jgi:serine/threonine protein kinase
VTTERCDLLAVDKDSPQEKICLTLVDILKGLIYLASKSIIHRNINLHNIFLDKLGQVKIGGLGLSLRASHIPFDKIVYKERALSQCLTLSP